MRVTDSNPSPKGSLKWIQLAVNRFPAYTNNRIEKACSLDPATSIHWVSPVQNDDYAEYRDADFLDRLSITLPGRALSTFWPNLGPQWDGLATTSRDEVLLVEAKANLPEVKSPGTQAGETSRRLIEQSLAEC